MCFNGLSLQEMDTVNRVQILDKADWISYMANNHENVRNPVSATRERDKV